MVRLFAAAIGILLTLAATSVSGATQYTYDELNRLTKVVYDDGRSIAYTFDAAGNLLTTARLASASGWLLQDDFTAPPINTALWNILGTPSVSGGFAQFPSLSRLDTARKVVIAGNRRIVIEGRMAGLAGSRDTHMRLVDTASGAMIFGGDTSYFGWGFYAYGSGEYNFVEVERPPGVGPAPQNCTALGGSTNQFMEYRWTLEGNRITLERGPTLATITQSATRTLGRSIVGRSFYLAIGTGGPAYSPGTWDAVRVSATAASGDTVSIDEFTTPAAYDNAGLGVAYGQTFTATDTNVTGLAAYLGDPTRPNDDRVDALRGPFTLELYAVAADGSVSLLASKALVADTVAGITGPTVFEFGQAVPTVAGQKYFMGLRAADGFGIGLQDLSASRYAGGAEAWLGAGSSRLTEYPSGRDLSFQVLSRRP